MNATVIKKLNEVIALWGLLGNPTQIEQMPVYFSSSLKATQQFGFEVGENVVTIYADAEGIPFDYTVFFKDREQVADHAVQRWLHETGQSGRQYTLGTVHGRGALTSMGEGQYVTLHPFGDRSEGRIDVDFEQDKGWHYGFVSPVCPQYIDKSVALQQLLDKQQNEYQALDIVSLGGHLMLDPEELIAELPDDDSHPIADMIISQAIQWGRKVLIGFIWDDDANGYTGIGMTVSGPDMVNHSKEYRRLSAEIYGSQAVTLLEALKNLMAGQPVVRIFRPTGVITPDIVRFLVQGGYKAHTWTVEIGAFRKKANTPDGPESNIAPGYVTIGKLGRDLTVPKDFSEIAGPLYMEDPFSEEFMEITQEYLANGYRMRFVNLWPANEGKGWVITRPDGSEIGLPMPSLAIAREVFELLTEQGEAALQDEIRARIDRAAEGNLLDEDSCWFAQYDASYLADTQFSLVTGDLAHDEDGEWWVKTTDDHLTDGVHPLLQRVTVKFGNDFWQRVRDLAACDDYHFLMAVEKITHAVLKPGDELVGQVIELSLFGRTFAFQVVKWDRHQPGEVDLNLTHEARAQAGFQRRKPDEYQLRYHL